MVITTICAAIDLHPSTFFSVREMTSGRFQRTTSYDENAFNGAVIKWIFLPLLSTTTKKGQLKCALWILTAFSTKLQKRPSSFCAVLCSQRTLTRIRSTVTAADRRGALAEQALEQRRTNASGLIVYTNDAVFVKPTSFKGASIWNCKITKVSDAQKWWNLCIGVKKFLGRWILRMLVKRLVSFTLGV